jgi:hypothetical protein
MKKLFALFLGLMLMLPMTASADFELAFTDVKASHSNFHAIEALSAFDVIGGYEDGTYRPDNTINRAEIVKILVLGLGNDPDAAVYKDCFPDVTDQWFARHVCFAAEKGWVTGYTTGADAGFYRPERPVNRVETLKILGEAYEMGDSLLETVEQELYTDVENSAWYAPYVEVWSRLNILEEMIGGTFSPSEGLKRSTMAEYVYRIMVVLRAGQPYTTGYEQGFIAENQLGFIYSLEFQHSNEEDEQPLLGEDGEDRYNGSGLEVSEFAYDETPEYVKITNNGVSNADLTGFYLKGLSNFLTYTYYFPSMVLAPGQSITVYSNSGTYSFGQGSNMWNDIDSEVRIYDDVDYLIYYYGDVDWD